MPNDDEHAHRRSVLLLVLAVVLILALTVGLATVLLTYEERGCADMGAHRVGTGSGRYLCVDGTGRVVGP